MSQPNNFQTVDKVWGPHTIDLFADFYNKQTSRFNSRCWNPNTEVVDAFTVDWHGENNWWCPPVWLVPRVIDHAQVCRAIGTLVVPCWLSASFWHLIHPSVEEIAPFVTQVEELPLSEVSIIPGLLGASLFNGGRSNVKILVLRCEFTGHP